MIQLYDEPNFSPSDHYFINNLIIELNKKRIRIKNKGGDSTSEKKRRNNYILKWHLYGMGVKKIHRNFFRDEKNYMSWQNIEQIINKYTSIMNEKEQREYSTRRGLNKNKLQLQRGTDPQWNEIIV